MDLGLGDGYSFHSDKQKGLQIALATVLPNAEHRVCARHVYGNWKKKFGDLDYKPFFWKVAYSYTKGEYTLHMDELLLYDREAYETLLAAEQNIGVELSSQKLEGRLMFATTFQKASTGPSKRLGNCL